MGFFPWISVADDGKPITTDKKDESKKVIKEGVDLKMLEELDLFLNLEMMQVLEGLEEEKQQTSPQEKISTKEKR